MIQQKQKPSRHETGGLNNWGIWWAGGWVGGWVGGGKWVGMGKEWVGVENVAMQVGWGHGWVDRGKVGGCGTMFG